MQGDVTTWSDQDLTYHKIMSHEHIMNTTTKDISTVKELFLKRFSMMKKLDKYKSLHTLQNIK